MLSNLRSTSAASSGVARGIIPGSVKLVRSSVQIVKRKSMPATTGIAMLTLAAKNGQLKKQSYKKLID